MEIKVFQKCDSEADKKSKLSSIWRNNILAIKSVWNPITSPEPFCRIEKYTFEKEFLEKEKTQEESPRDGPIQKILSEL